MTKERIDRNESKNQEPDQYVWSSVPQTFQPPANVPVQGGKQYKNFSTGKWSPDEDPLLKRWEQEEAAGETQPIAMANVAVQKEDSKSSSETKAGLEQSLAGQQTDEVETNHQVQKSQQKSVKSKKKSSLSSQEQSELANVIQQLLGFWKPVGMFVAGIIYQWLYHNGQPARWLLQVFVPGWDGLEKDVAQGLPKHWAFQAGQSLGDGLALATGIIEIITGGGAAAGGASLCTTGLGCLAGAPAMVGGLALGLHGSATSASALTSIAARLGIVFHSSTGEGNSESDTAERSSIQSHEEAGGHTDDRHVGKSENWLRKRLAEDPNLESASSFYNEEAANRTQGRFVKQFRQEIEAWQRSGELRLIKEFDMDNPIGIVVRRNKKGSPLRAVETNRVRLVLVTDNSSQGWHFLTSFPIK